MSIRAKLLLPALLLTAGLSLTACGQSAGIAGSAGISAAATKAAPTTASTQSSPSQANSSAAATTSQAAAGTKTAATTSAAPAGAPVVSLARAGALGQVLVDSKNLTMYAFTNDTNGKSTCFDACAAAWPAVIVPAGIQVGKDLSAGAFGSTDRPDGSKQLTIKGHPLYLYTGDGAAGDTNGQGVGGKWFTVSADGALIGKEVATGAAPLLAGAASAGTSSQPSSSPRIAPVTTAAPKTTAAATGPVVGLAQVGNLGEVMVGANGHTLYAFTDDHDGQSTCFNACEKAWPPLTVSADFKLSAELNANGVSLFQRPDGSKQLVMGNWPVYFFAGDAAPGDANGQGAKGKWFAVNRHCKLVKEPVS